MFWQLCSKLLKTKFPAWSTLYPFDDTKPLALAMDDVMVAIMCFYQPEHMDNVDYFKTLTALIKVYEQYAGPFGYQIEKVVDKAAAEAKEQGHPLSSDKVLARKKVEEQKIQDHTIAYALIKYVDKQQYGKLQASLANTYTLGNNKYLDMVRKPLQF